MIPKAAAQSHVVSPLLRPRMPELDTVRGMAILGVLLYHGFYWSRALDRYTPAQRLFLKAMALGQYGVNLFFVLSGFLITGILIDSKAQPNYYKRFYVRRALRILPAYYGTLLLLVVFGMTTKSFLWMSLLYSSNLSLLFGIAMSYGVLWSLAIEEHFYLVWPAIVRKVNPGALLWAALCILVVSPMLRFLCSSVPLFAGHGQGGCSYYTWNCADGLALGALMAILVRRMNNDRRQLMRLSLLLSATGFLIGLAGIPFGIMTKMNAAGEALQWVPGNLEFAAMLGFLLLASSGRLAKYVVPRPLTFLGDISYGLYLYHLLFFHAYDWLARWTQIESRLHLTLWEQVWFKMIFSSSAAILFSYASRWYLEEPFLRMKEWLDSSAKSSQKQDRSGLSKHRLQPESETQISE